MPTTTIRALAVGSIVGSTVVVAVLGDVLFGAPLWGGAAGLLSGIGIYLLIPAVAAPDGDGDAPAAAPLGVHRLAAGITLSSVVPVSFAVLFVFESVHPAVGPLAGLALAALEYPGLARVLPELGGTGAVGG